MTKDGAANKGFSLPFARIALVLAALIALGAIAIAALRTGKDGESPAPEAAPAAAAEGQVPEVGAMIGDLEKKMTQNPADPRGWFLLGQAYYHVGRYPDSVKAYSKAAAIDPNNSILWSALGEVQVLSGTGGVTPDAEASFRKALAIDPKDHRARYFMAVRKDRAGDHKGAVDDLIAILNDSPPDAPWVDPVRKLTEKIAGDKKIDIAGRMPAAQAASLPLGPPSTGDSVVTDGIPGPTAQDLKAATSMTPVQQDEMARGMVDRLDARLKDNPRDADRWIMLMRSRMQLQQVGAAKDALARAKAAFKDDPRQQARFDQAAQLYNVPR